MVSVRRLAPFAKCDDVSVTVMDAGARARPMRAEVPLCTSIAMATYNGGAYLEEQLQSFLRQTVLPDEVVICDDGSTDGTMGVLQSFAAEAEFSVVVIRRRESRGVSATFGEALAATSGEVVLLADQDDVWHENKLERVLAAFKRHPDRHLLIHDLEFCDEGLRRIGERKLARVRRFADPRVVYVTGMATAARRGFLELCLPLPDETIVSHDQWLHECANALGTKLILDEVLADYRRHSSNATAASYLNAPRQSSWLGLLRARVRVAWSNGGLQVVKEATQSRVIEAWLERRAPRAVEEGWVAHQRWRDSLDRVAARRIAAEERARVVRTPRWLRWPAILRLWWVGKYRAFNGIATAVRDMLVPATATVPDVDR